MIRNGEKYSQEIEKVPSMGLVATYSISIRKFPFLISNLKACVRTQQDK